MPAGPETPRQRAQLAAIVAALRRLGTQLPHDVAEDPVDRAVTGDRPRAGHARPAAGYAPRGVARRGIDLELDAASGRDLADGCHGRNRMRVPRMPLKPLSAAPSGAALEMGGSALRR